MAPRIIAEQLARPSGLLGAFIRGSMNRHNAKMNAFTLDLLDLQPTDRVLEIGFGGGGSLPKLITSAAFVVGVDRSPDAVRAATRLYRREIAAGRVSFREGEVESLPCETGEFDKICTINTVYFWQSLAAGFAQIYRGLAPGGRVAIGFLPKLKMERMNMPADIFTLRDPDDVIVAMEETGFKDIRVERPEPSTPWNTIVGGR